MHGTTVKNRNITLTIYDTFRITNRILSAEKSKELKFSLSTS